MSTTVGAKPEVVSVPEAQPASEVMNEILLSTGAFVGRVNGRNHKLIIDYAGQINCDGFEFLMYPDYYEKLTTILADFKTAQINFPVVHFDKAVGDLLNIPDNESLSKALDLFKKNCELAQKIGAEKFVLHAWGVPNSDEFVETIYERVGHCLEIAKAFKLDMLVENIFCKRMSPLRHLNNLAELFPSVGFTMDTRSAQFHGELLETCESSLWAKSIRHVHINDYNGGYMDWSATYPIPQPSFGKIDWAMFFSKLKEKDYKSSLTLEAPSMIESGVYVKTLNNSLEFIKNGLSLKEQ